jgi:hypothetical protein
MISFCGFGVFFLKKKVQSAHWVFSFWKEVLRLSELSIFTEDSKHRVAREIQ